MIVKATRGVELAVFLNDRDNISIAVAVPGVPDAIIVALDPNHAEALELAIKAARTEAHARSVSS